MNKYHDLSECTLNDDERFREKNEIIQMFVKAKLDPHRFTDSEFNFILKMHHAAQVTVKQLFWLRDLKEKFIDE